MIVIHRCGLDTVKWEEAQDKYEDLKLLKQWINIGDQPFKNDLKMRSATIQRLEKNILTD